MQSSVGSDLGASFIGQTEWKTFYVRGSPLDVDSMERDGSLVIPADFDWKHELSQRHKAYQVIRNIKVEVHKEEFVKAIVFNSEDPDAWKLAEGEYIVEVRVRAAKVVDNIQFLTNRNRIYGGGGAGGYYNVYKGQCLVGGLAPVEFWYFKYLVRSFVPFWYQDPLYRFVVKKKVEKIDIVVSDIVQYLAIFWNDGTSKRAGAEFPGLVSKVIQGNEEDEDFHDHLDSDDELTTVDQLGLTENTPKIFSPPGYEKYKKYEIILGPNEFVVGFEVRASSILDAISFQTNEQYLGPYGGTGGSLKGYVSGENLQDLDLESVVRKDQSIVKKIFNPRWQTKPN
eukprot:TRINITY_DN6022_c0_g1_i1.p1 TRINITY_DN6022_c0_g1~~TRINITY_DN6022_c0_g1_i1.p1  ORF type:complete len:340 (-),score=60.53 TRINITY_DN6022_c0_g1_i1:179-1198(-)